ncbi:MAG: hypothetical protein HZT40_19725 [Candidatus Thiothrix singaporensis]|uniref:Uncharacterized protein n=1 Tax=Candidatus Thiothrix singaporensis TaxID=2799669 RepID=A0A7L6AWD2_9GAMM|nr:MAG: hypothetical protein HZT40_19725 [Candidatus Thiothrix singaporensis]
MIGIARQMGVHPQVIIAVTDVPWKKEKMNESTITYRRRLFNNIGVHDAYMSGISVDKGISIITMKLISGEVTSICFDKLERMLCNGFREGNIILDIYFEKRKDFAKNLLYDIYPIYDVNDEHYQDMIEKIVYP